MNQTAIKISLVKTNNNTFENNDGEQRMTSLEIAELTGKQHFHVMEAIRKMEPAWMKVAASKFRLGSYKDTNGQLRPCYSLTKTECLYIATKFNDEARARLVIRWEQLERASQSQLALHAIFPKATLIDVERWNRHTANIRDPQESRWAKVLE